MSARSEYLVTHRSKECRCEPGHIFGASLDALGTALVRIGKIVAKYSYSRRLLARAFGNGRGHCSCQLVENLEAVLTKLCRVSNPLAMLVHAAHMALRVGRR